MVAMGGLLAGVRPTSPRGSQPARPRQPHWPETDVRLALPAGRMGGCHHERVPFSVLVVDDDSAFRDLAARVLTGWGHVVVGEAGNVAEALERAAEVRPQAALVDVGL